MRQVSNEIVDGPREEARSMRRDVPREASKECPRRRPPRSSFVWHLDLRTVSTKLQVEHISHLDVDDTEETLVLSLELLLVKDLHGHDGRVLDRSAEHRKRSRHVVNVKQASSPSASYSTFETCAQVETLKKRQRPALNGWQRCKKQEQPCRERTRRRRRRQRQLRRPLESQLRSERADANSLRTCQSSRSSTG